MDVFHHLFVFDKHKQIERFSPPSIIEAMDQRFVSRPEYEIVSMIAATNLAETKAGVRSNGVVPDRSV